MSWKTQNGRLASKLLTTQSFTADGASTQSVVDSSGNIYFIGGGYWRDYFVEGYDNANFRGAVFKIDQNGDLDVTFMNNCGTQGLGSSSFTSRVQCVDVDPVTGDIVVVGTFTTWDGVACPQGIIRLDNTGTPVSAYNTNLGYGLEMVYPQYYFGQVAGMTTDVFLWAGTYGYATITLNFNGTDTIQTVVNAYNAANPTNQILTDSTSDLTQIPNNGTSFAFTAQSDDNLFSMKCKFNSAGVLAVIGGFTQANRNYGEGAALINSNGTINTTFSSAIAGGFAISYYGNEPKGVVWTDSNTKLVFSGSFNGSAGFNANGTEGIVKLSTSGVEDSTFMTNAGTGFNFGSEFIFQDSAGNLFVTGGSDNYAGTDIAYGITKLSSAGVLNATFDANLGGPFQGFYDTVWDIVFDGSDNLFVSGEFTQVETLPSPTPFLYLGKMDNDGVVDATFQSNMGTGFGGFGNFTATLYSGVLTCFGDFFSFDGQDRYYAAQVNDDGTNNDWFYPVVIVDNWTAPAGVTCIGISMAQSLTGGSPYNMQMMEVVPNTTYTIDTTTYAYCSVFGTYRYQGYSSIVIWWVE